MALSKTMASDLANLTEPTERVVRLRDRARERAHEPERFDTSERDLLMARCWRRTAGESHILRRGIMAGDALRGLTPLIDEDELLVGKFSLRKVSSAERQEIAAWRSETDLPGQAAHMAIDYERVLRLGASGVRRLIEGYRARLSPSEAEADCFYRGCLASLDGMVSLSNAYADEAERLVTLRHAQGDESDVSGGAEAVALRQAQGDESLRPGKAGVVTLSLSKGDCADELKEIARICRTVPSEPAETFREAIQAVHFATFCMCAGNRFLLMQLGRPDRYLWPYYQRDLAAGRITPDEAQELIDCLGIMLSEYTPRGLAVGWMAGGRDEWGNDVTNDLTYMFVRAGWHIRLAYPGIGLCWTPDTPADLMDMAARTLAHGCTHPALFNDDVISSGLMQLGLAHRDACLFTHSTCVEITPIAISNVYVASPYFNLIQPLHDVLGIPPLGGEPGPAPEIASYGDLLDRYKRHVAEAICEGVAEQNGCMRERDRVGGFPLVSCFVNDCLAKGRDIDHGGARANWIETSFVGLANLADALAAIRILVFEKKALTLGKLREALLANFEGHADVLAMLNKAPKYGNDDDEVDAVAVDITDFLRAECSRHRTYWGDRVVPGFFCWVMHEYFGRQTCASADGRAAGFPFADGSGPAQGRERLGPTAMVRSVTKWDHSPMIGGIAVNFRFARGSDANAMLQVLETFLTLGGFEAQVNVVDAATLRDAQAHPECHRDLVVRIAGYSDYFVGLSPEMQAEVIARSELPL